jgi:hypothetical protein
LTAPPRTDLRATLRELVFRGRNETSGTHKVSHECSPLFHARTRKHESIPYNNQPKRGAQSTRTQNAARTRRRT